MSRTVRACPECGETEFDRYETQVIREQHTVTIEEFDNGFPDVFEKYVEPRDVDYIDNLDETRIECSSCGYEVDEDLSDLVPEGMLRCSVCDAVYADNGDGYDGECPTCADRGEPV